MSDEFSEATFREKPDISQIFLRQIDRTNQAIIHPDPGDFEALVRVSMKFLPLFWRQWVIEPEQSERYNNEVETWEYKYNCGIAMGTPEAPIMRNDPSSMRYDPSKPTTVYSPILVTETVTDYEELYDVVMEAAERAGLTWRTEYRETQIVIPKKEIIRQKTPVLRAKNDD